MTMQKTLLDRLSARVHAAARLAVALAAMACAFGAAPAHAERLKDLAQIQACATTR